MTTVLHINASGSIDQSISRASTGTLVARLAPTRIISRDLAETPLPQVDETWINARLVPEADRTDTERAALALSDELIGELQAADVVVIGMPMYNFGMPAALKAWVDLVARPDVTFRYTENGPIGLLEGKRAIVSVASGGVPIDSAVDFATPHMCQVLRFIGITEIAIDVAKNTVSATAA